MLRYVIGCQVKYSLQHNIMLLQALKDTQQLSSKSLPTTHCNKPCELDIAPPLSLAPPSSTALGKLIVQLHHVCKNMLKTKFSLI